ncbi:hypothetical protein HDU82_002460 [Entophlyctis luteolus]|nr:hypothetical protein HDU82_002460 [Entophlyctis luteolus]
MEQKSEAALELDRQKKEQVLEQRRLDRARTKDKHPPVSLRHVSPASFFGGRPVISCSSGSSIWSAHGNASETTHTPPNSKKPLAGVAPPVCWLLRLPPEVVHLIVVRLPIGPLLVDVALSGRSVFAPLILSDVAAARRHIQFQFAKSLCDSLWKFLDESDIKFNGYVCLPFAYQVAVYCEILRAPDIQQRDPHTGQIIKLNDPGLSNLMCPERWRIPSPRNAVRRMSIAAAMTANTSSSNDSRALRWSALLGETDALRMLLSAPGSRADPASRNNYAIGEASTRGHSDAVALLLSDPRCNPADNENYAIAQAALFGHAGVVGALLRDRRVDPAQAIEMAVQGNCADVVKLLLADDRVDCGIDSNWCLKFACQEGWAPIVELLLANRKVDPSDTENNALELAVCGGHSAVVELLLGDDRVDPGSSGNRSLNIACEIGNCDIVRMLLKNPRTNPADCDSICIKTAVFRRHSQIVALLLEDTRADPSVQDNWCLSCAIFRNDLQIVSLLLQDPRVSVTRKAFDIAILNGRLECLRLLKRRTRLFMAFSLW